MVSPDQEAILTLLVDELREIAATDAESPSELSERLARWECHCDHLHNATNLAGLTGLGAVCHWLLDNVRELVKTKVDGPLNDTAARLDILGDWPRQLDVYLQTFLADRAGANAQLLDFLALEAWPLPLTPPLRQRLERELTELEFNVQEQRGELPATVNSQMVSLAIPEDVRPELLEGLLLELPEQASGFERAIVAYAEFGSDRQLDSAQRLAHTIKGAANVVNIAGLANLMHYTEDLFEVAVLHRILLSPPFGSLLMKISDCLSASADYLCCMGPQPDNLASTLQEIIDTIRQLRESPLRGPSAGADRGADSKEVGNRLNFDLRELQRLTWSLEEEEEDGPLAIHCSGNDSPAKGSTAENTQSPREETPPASEIAPRGQESSEREDNRRSSADGDSFRLQVSEDTAQELLRLAGESQITNGQLSAQIAALQASAQQSERYHRQIKTMAAELESLIQTSSARHKFLGEGEDGQRDPLELERYSELHSFSNQLLELTTDSQESISHLAQQVVDLTEVAYRQKQIIRANQELLLKLRLVSVESIVPRLQRCVRQAARLVDKQVILQVHGSELSIDSKVLSRIAAPIMHLLRNAVDHGIESDPKARLSCNKPAQGQITLDFQHLGENIIVRCRDDGRGLDDDAIRARAIQAGLISSDEQVEEAFLRQLIMLPNFSTRPSVSQTSGRGIGLDAVSADIQQLNGQLSLSSVPGAGSCFEIRVPASILTVHALVVRCRSEGGTGAYSLVSHSIEQIAYLDSEQRRGLLHSDTFRHDEVDLPLHSLELFLGLSPAPLANCSAVLVVRKVDGSRIALAVATVQSSQDLVVKPLNEFCYRPDGVMGATVLGDGTVSPVVDLQKLPGMNLSARELARLRERQLQTAQATGGVANKARVLIVDDSLSVRRSLAQFVADLGMDALTVRDGFEAIHSVTREAPTLMLVDLEMPRMNGLELTAHLRTNEATRDLPVIMITSRATEKHRRLAESAGVNGYLNKPWSDDDLLAAIREHIR